VLNEKLIDHNLGPTIVLLMVIRIVLTCEIDMSGNVVGSGQCRGVNVGICREMDFTVSKCHFSCTTIG